MNDITKLMIEMYKLEQLGYDFLGYEKLPFLVSLAFCWNVRISPFPDRYLC